MLTRLDDPLVRQAVADARAAALAGGTYPSPADWRDAWIYFVLIDRFNNPDAPPAGTWHRFYSRRQGGTFNGVTAQLDYLRELGCGAIWLSPVVKNPRPDDWEFVQHDGHPGSLGAPPVESARRLHQATHRACPTVPQASR